MRGKTTALKKILSILADEEPHLDWLEAQFEQVKQMGIQVYLVEQIKA